MSRALDGVALCLELRKQYLIGRENGRPVACELHWWMCKYRDANARSASVLRTTIPACVMLAPHGDAAHCENELVTVRETMIPRNPGDLLERYEDSRVLLAIYLQDFHASTKLGMLGCAVGCGTEILTQTSPQAGRSGVFPLILAPIVLSVIRYTLAPPSCIPSKKIPGPRLRTWWRSQLVILLHTLHGWTNIH